MAATKTLYPFQFSFYAGSLTVNDRPGYAVSHESPNEVTITKGDTVARFYIQANWVGVYVSAVVHERGWLLSHEAANYGPNEQERGAAWLTIKAKNLKL